MQTTKDVLDKKKKILYPIRTRLRTSQFISGKIFPTIQARTIIYRKGVYLVRLELCGIYDLLLFGKVKMIDENETANETDKHSINDGNTFYNHFCNGYL